MDLEKTCLQMIQHVGGARSLYIEAIQHAKKNDFEWAQQAMKDGESLFMKAHQMHSQLIQMEAQDEILNITLLLIHAEDQLLSAESFKIIAYEFIELYKKIDKE